MLHRITMYTLYAMLTAIVGYKAVVYETGLKPEYADCNSFRGIDAAEGLVEPPPPVELLPSLY